MNIRLKQFLSAENITQAQFADSINVVRASVSHILAGRNNPSFDFIKAMMTKYPALNIEWLIFGKGKMYKDSPTSASAAPELLFPEPEPDYAPAQEIPEILTQPEKTGTTPFSSELKTSDNNTQTIVKQRNVSKIIVFFDDGSYQEM